MILPTKLAYEALDLQAENARRFASGKKMRSGFSRSSMKTAASSSGRLAHFRLGVNFDRRNEGCDTFAPLDTADAATVGLS